jgi:hypothetical protein
MPAQMPRHRAGQDRDHAKAAAEGQRGQDPAFGDAEHRLRGRLASRKQAGIAEAGNDKGRGVGFLLADDAAERQDHPVRIGLTLDARRSLIEGQTIYLGPAGDAQRRHRIVDGTRDRGGRVRIDDEDAVAHRPLHLGCCYKSAASRVVPVSASREGSA